MSSDRTQHQSNEELAKARELSLEPIRPPSNPPGYRIQGFVGRGSYGEVWLATDLKTGRQVAIKFYLHGSGQQIKRLADEVEKLVVLSADRYVVQLLDVGWEAEPPYYVMEYIEHGSLEDLLRFQGSIDTVEAVELFRELALGMMHLHGKGILHCDLKPGNVLLDEGGRPRVADFGQSRLTSDQSAALGTLFYMAPEQADTTAVPDSGWDVYALGALLFSMLTGKPPYHSDELAKKIDAVDSVNGKLELYRKSIQRSPVPKSHRSVPGVDRSLADIIDRCIVADPKQRFPSIQSVLLALRQRDQARARQPIMILGLLGPLLLIGLGALFGWWAFKQAVYRTDQAVTAKAKDSNDFAAQLAARSAAEQIDEYFRVVTQLAKDDAFIDLFDIAIADDDLKNLRMRIADPSLNPDSNLKEDPLKQERQDFRELEVRQNLQPFLESRLENLEGLYPRAASWFVSDRFGNQLASVFDGENVTLGGNFCYRTYFTGMEKDLELTDARIAYSEDPEKLSQRPIIQRPHLSAVFQSKQSKTWKIAFSAPIRRYGEIAGIVAVTADLGQFIEFPHSFGQYTMLVDGRKGEFSGSVLEHPAYEPAIQLEELQVGKRRLPDEMAQSSVDVSCVSEDEIFYDPVGETSYGQRTGYGNPSIATCTPVMMREANRIYELNGDEMINTDVRQATGLYVVAVQDFESVLSEVRSLSTQLGRMAILATLLLSGVAIGMWIFVNRLLKNTRERLSRSLAPQDNSWLLDMETLATSKSARIRKGTQSKAGLPTVQKQDD